MFIDTQEEFSVAQAIASVVGDVVSTNVYDTGAAADVGIGEEIYVYAKTVAAMAGAGSSVQVVVQTSDVVDSGYTDAGAGQVVPLASAGANKAIARFRLPIGLKRYIRLAYRISGATVTGGTVSAFLALDVPANVSNASGVSAV